MNNCGLISSNPISLSPRNFASGPMRVLPGRLSVSRTFGDIEAKLRKFGGIPGVIVADPDIKEFRL